MNINRAIRIEIDGQVYDQWDSADITRDLNDFAGTFCFNFRDTTRSLKTFAFASNISPIFQLRPGAEVKIFVHDELVLLGFIETVSPNIDENSASVSVTGKDKAGDLVDCAAAPEGPAELNNVTLEDAAKRIAKPYGLKVRSEIDTGEVFPRFGIDMTETGLSALEKGARQRQALLLSDGIGGLVITRSGANRAPDDLKLPGNVKSSNGSFTHKNRHSKTIVRGQSEKAAGKRKGGLDGTAAPLSAGGTPVKPEDRQSSDGSATEIERAGTAATGIAYDDEVRRYRPKVHLARTKGNRSDCECEANWRSRSRRGQSEEMNYVVHGFKPNQRLWRVNEMVYVSDHFQLIERDMLISRVSFSENDDGRMTTLTITSPEAFDNRPVKGRRKNKKGKKKNGQSGPLDGTASAL